MKRFVTRWNGEIVATYDMLLALAVILLALFVLASPPRPKAAEDQKTPGELAVMLFWPDDLDVDLDLWVQTPGARPIGYSRQNAATANLLRDDLGFTNDPSQRNFEVAYSRVLPAGEYVTNVHVYSARAAVFPIPARVIVQARIAGAPTATLAAVDVPLRHPGEEATAVRFRLDAHGVVVPGSVNSLPRRLRDAQ